MTVETVRSMLAWSSVINIGFLLAWFLMFMAARDWIYRMHTKWFSLSRETFDAIHYAGLAFYKLCIFMFNLIPYLALRILA